MESLRESIEINGPGVVVPDRCGSIVLELGRQVADCFGHAVGDIGHHQSGLVGLISVPGHAQPCNVLTVRAPRRLGIISAAHRNDIARTVSDIIYVDFGVRAESVFLARLLLARVCDILSVRAPIQLFHPAERLRRQLVKLVL